jgi:hypothetical protein
MTSAFATRWRARFRSILAWAIIAGSFVVGYVAMLRTKPLYVPDSAHYLAKALWFLGATPAEAHAQVAAYAARHGISVIPGVDVIFGWGLVQPRVVLSALAMPFVAAFGPIGLAITTGIITAALAAVLGFTLMRRYGNVAAVGVMIMVNCSAYIMWYSGAMLTESLSALLTALTLVMAWRYLREPRGWLLLAMAALTIASAFTRQATLIVVGAFAAAWVLSMLVGRSWRSPWMWPAITVGAAGIGSQLLQSILFPSFSQVAQFLKATGTDSLGAAVLAIPALARHILSKDVGNFLANDRILLVLILVALAGIVLFWRRAEAHLLVGAIVAISIYNVTNGTPTSFRYAMPGLVFYVVSAALVISATGQRLHTPERAADDPTTAGSDHARTPADFRAPSLDVANGRVSGTKP